MAQNAFKVYISPAGEVWGIFLVFLDKRKEKKKKDPGQINSFKSVFRPTVKTFWLALEPFSHILLCFG